jgi:N-acetylmuramoyl-L-alanine amidase
MKHVARALLMLLVAAGASTDAVAQSSPRLEVEREDGTSSTVSLRLDRGYAVVPVALLDELGWEVSEDDGGITLSAAGEITVAMRVGSPFFRWDGVVLQMSDAPYRVGSQTFVPLQFLSDFLPRRLPGLYEFDGPSSVLRAGDPALLGEAGGLLAAAGASTAAVASTATAGGAGASAGGAGTAAAAAAAAVGGGAPDTNSADAVRMAGPSPYDGVRVVVIDPGHGGADPGALGPDGIREKTVALEIGLRLAEYLEGQPGLEVHLIRDDDTFVDVWERGQIATKAKGERPGIFVSIHANSFPARREARGFETYFLSDARTEHERRVSAIENAPLAMNPDFEGSEQGDDLDFIFRDLVNYDHAHWSANLAGLVQDELKDFHPGPDRGVKQGVLAVLTNALMPSVLIEIGYLSNPQEAPVLAKADFHESSAAAIGDAVLRFFERYPPGSGTGGDREPR